jgi:arylsulfatase A-like enzyme
MGNKTQKPNILFIVSDDAGYRDFGPYGGDGAAYLLALPVVSWVGNAADALHDGY